MKKALIAICMLTTLVTNAKTLIAYYSYTNTVNTIISDLRTQIDADVIRIEPAEKNLDYAANNYAIGSALMTAIRNNPNSASSYPAIDPVNINLDNYDTIILATPLWWSNMAAPFQSFLFKYGQDMAGKQICLIVSSASSGISGVVADAKRLVPDGKFIEPYLWIRSSQISNRHSLIAQWLIDIDYQRIASAITTINDNNEPDINISTTGISVPDFVENVSVYGVNGQLILNATNTSVSRSFQSGFYIVNLKYGNKTFTKKVIVK